MRYFLIAGEPSGDMHGSALMAEIKKADQKAEFMFCGGDLMTTQGGKLLIHYQDMAYMGLLPVILNLKNIWKNFKSCKENLKKFNPAVLILIDYPGFNLRMAKFAKKNGIKTAYYISPKVWAWKTGRVKQIKAFVDDMYTIFPFETLFYSKFNYEVNYVGNPVFDIIKEEMSKESDFDIFCKKNDLSGKPIIALLAGSRKNEISSLLPIMEQMPEYFSGFQFVIAGAPGNLPEFYKSRLKADIPVIFNQTYELLKNSRAAIVTSGTATLETALIKTPQVVCYKMGMGWFLELFRKQILKTRYFSLVNLVAEKEVVKELFQSQVTVENLKHELTRLISDDAYRDYIQKEYDKIAEKLGSEGAAEIAALQIVSSVKNQKR